MKWKKKLIVLFSVLLIVTNCMYVSAAPDVGGGDSGTVVVDEENTEDASEEEVSDEKESDAEEKSEEESDKGKGKSEIVVDEDGIIHGEKIDNYDYDEIDVMSTNGHSQAEAVSWAQARANEHWEINDGSGWTQCVEFLWAYYEYLVGYHVRGNACDYLGDTYGACPAGWTRPDKWTAQPGDIVIWGAYTALAPHEFGHIGVITAVNGSTLTTAEANAGYARGACSTYTRDLSGVTGIIRPDFVDTTAQEMTSGYDRVLPDGNYLIASAGYADKSSYLYLDINGTAVPAADGANVAVCTSQDPANIPAYEIWTIRYANGFYTIKQMNTNMSLDVQGASGADGANVMVYSSHSGTNQQWAISHNGRDGYRIQSKCNGKSLDVLGGVFESGTNIGTWTSNTSVMQSWLFIPYNPAQPIKNGRYMMVSTLNKNYILDVAGDTGDIPDNTNVQIWQDSAQAQFNEFEIVALSNGYYKFVHVASGKVMEVTGGKSNLENNIALHTDNGTIAQQWAIIPGDYGYCMVSRCSGLTLNFDGSKVANGTNVSQWYYDNDAYQENWLFVPAEYSITYNMNGGKGSIPAQTKYYKNNLKLSTTIPTKEGKKFAGWSTNKNATTAEYVSGATFKKDSNTILYAVWKDAKVTSVFRDIPSNAWYVNAVQYVYDKGIMTGTGSDTFSPNTALTRAQVVTVLYSMAGKPSQSFNSSFTDVKSSDYFAIPVSWAYAKKITSGTGNGKFSPNAKITREQLAVMLYKYASMKKYNLTSYGKALDGFSDKNKVSNYATDAMKWAVTQEIISGKGDGRLDPQGTATRAECAAMVMKLLQKNGQ